MALGDHFPIFDRDHLTAFIAALPEAFEHNPGTGYRFSGTILQGRVGPFYPRTELGLTWRQHTLDDVDFDDDGGFGDALGIGSLTGASESASGEIESLSLMYNLWIDIGLQNCFVPFLGAAVPYFGGGLGGIYISGDEIKVRNVEIVDDDDVAFAYQLGLGVGFEVNDWLTLTVDYRWLRAAEPELETEIGGDFDTEFDSHSLGAGLRYFF